MAEAASLEIAGRAVGAGHRCFIIAEIGINHGGDGSVCATMIEVAAAAGADAVKLQTVAPEESYHPDTDSYRIFKDSVLSEAALARLMEIARSRDILLFSTPGDRTSLELVVRLGMPAIKISSGLLTNTPLIELAARTGMPLILSTGMARKSEIEAARIAVARGGRSRCAFLQCTSLYPAPADSLDLGTMAALSKLTGAPVGYSDHYQGSLACVAAVAMGASLIEKHFTLDPRQTGADHAISADPEIFSKMVRDIREVEQMRGSVRLAPHPLEELQRENRHRRLVAARDLAPGETIEPKDVFLMRMPPQSKAMPAHQFDRIIGCRTTVQVSRLSGFTSVNVGLAR